MPERLPLSAARPRCEVLPIISRLIKTGSVNPLRLPARSPNLNSYAERVRSVKEECLSRLILFGESSLRRALQQYSVHYHEERNHQGKDNRILFPSRPEARRNMGAVRCRERRAPAEVLREGSGIKVTGQRAMGSQHILRILGISTGKGPRGPDFINVR